LWQRSWLRDEVVSDELDYWKRRLAGAQTRLDLPTDRPRPKAQTFTGERLPFQLSQSLLEELMALCLNAGVTLFMALLAAFKVLLCRYTGQDDIIVGTNVANRTRAEIEGLIGFFVNLLALRTDCSGNPSFAQLLERVREITLGAYTHQELPFEWVVGELQPERDLSYSPLFQVVFSFQNAPSPALELTGLKLSLLDIEMRRRNSISSSICGRTSGDWRGRWSTIPTCLIALPPCGCYRILKDCSVALPRNRMPGWTNWKYYLKKRESFSISQ